MIVFDTGGQTINQLRLFRKEMMHYTVELNDDEFHVFVMELRKTYNKTFFTSKNIFLTLKTK